MQSTVPSPTPRTAWLSQLRTLTVLLSAANAQFYAGVKSFEIPTGPVYPGIDISILTRLALFDDLKKSAQPIYLRYLLSRLPQLTDDAQLLARHDLIETVRTLGNETDQSTGSGLNSAKFIDKTVRVKLKLPKDLQHSQYYIVVCATKGNESDDDANCLPSTTPLRVEHDPRHRQ